MISQIPPHRPLTRRTHARHSNGRGRRNLPSSRTILTPGQACAGGARILQNLLPYPGTGPRDDSSKLEMWVPQNLREATGFLLGLAIAFWLLLPLVGVR